MYATGYVGISRFSPNAFYSNGFPMPDKNTRMSDYVEKIQRQTRVAGDAIFLEILSAFSVAFANYDVNGYSGIKMPLTLYSLLVMPSGTGKSRLFGVAFDPLHQLDEEDSLLREQEISEYKRSLSAWKSVENNIRKHAMWQEATGRESEVNWKKALSEHISNKPSMSMRPKLIRTKATTSGLMKSLSENLPIGIIINSDSGDLLKSEIFRNPNDICDSWSGNSLKIESGVSDLVIEKPRLSIALATQTDFLSKLLKQFGSVFIASGLMARFLMSIPYLVPDNFVYSDEVNDGEKKENGYSSDLYFLLNKNVREVVDSPRERKCLTLESAARVSLEEYYLRTKRMAETCQEVDDEIRPSLFKAAENATRISAILALIEHPEIGYVSNEFAKQAISVVDFYINELSNFIRYSKMDKLQLDSDLLLDFICRAAFSYPPKEIDRRFIQQFGPRQLRERNRLTHALEILQMQKKIRFEYRPVMGRKSPRKVYFPSSVPDPNASVFENFII